MVIPTTHAQLTSVLKEVYRLRPGRIVPIAPNDVFWALEPDGLPPADAILPAAPGVPFGIPNILPGEHDTIARGRRLTRAEPFPIGLRLQLRPTRFRRSVESIRAWNARFLREAQAEVEAFLG